METKKTYYGKIDGYDAMSCDYIPEDMVVEREEIILYPQEGYILEKDGEQFDCVEITDNNEINNYKELEISENQ